MGGIENYCREGNAGRRGRETERGMGVEEGEPKGRNCDCLEGERIFALSEAEGSNKVLYKL